MSFVSIAFALLYGVALAWRLLIRSGTRIYAAGLLCLSWTFYAWHAPHYLWLLLLTTLVDYVAARLLVSERLSPRWRGVTLVASLALNVGLLSYFKYDTFIAESIVVGARLFGLSLVAAIPQHVLPIGISFYTFMSMSYTIDVYRRRLRPETDFVRFACYLAFFPHLVAGPIIRGGEFLYQFRRQRRWRAGVFAEGSYLILRGLFLKVVVADNLGQIIDRAWSHTAGHEGDPVLALALVVFFAGQLFCDFAGYTDIARGLGYQLGFRLPINFNAPYLAATFTDFWRRWHITLSSWMRDYLYVPLGGNRRGYWRALVNVLLVMTISGLWHGANWKFAAWGALHGTAIAIERGLGIAHGARSRWLAAAWYGVVQATWILSLALFRAADITEGWSILGKAALGLMRLPVSLPSALAADGPTQAGWWFLLPVVGLHGRAWLSERFGVARPAAFERAIYSGAMLAALLTLYTTARQFIYFQF